MRSAKDCYREKDASVLRKNGRRRAALLQKNRPHDVGALLDFGELSRAATPALLRALLEHSRETSARDTKRLKITEAN